MNVNGGIPAEVAERAVALRDLHGGEVDRVALLVAILRRFEAEVNLLDSVATRYRPRSATIGRRVRLVRPQGDLVTDVIDVDDDGLLVTELGGVRQVFS